MADATVRLRYHCGCFRWDLGGSSFEDPPDCPGEGEIEVDLEEWEGGHVSHDCEACGQTLCQQDDHFEEIPPDETTSAV